MIAYMPYNVEMDQVASFLVDQFGGEALTIINADNEAETYLEWSLPDFEYQYVNEHRDHSRRLRVKFSQGSARITLLF